MSTFRVDLKVIRSAADLAQMVGIPSALVTRMLDGDPELFLPHQIPKRGVAGYREVWEVRNEPLADALKSFDSRFQAYAPNVLPGYPHVSCHGYVRDRSIYTNAELHLRSRVLVRADIHNFFPSITTGRVANTFLDLGLPAVTADLLSRFVTFQGTLPMGFCTSPAIANAVSFRLDTDLARLAAEHGYRYSRYSDDLTFSGLAEPPNRITIESELQKHGFVLNRRKFRVKLRGQSFYVTGLSVSEPDKPRAPRKLKRRLRQELRFAEKHGLMEHLGRKDYASFQSGINKIDGRIRFLNSIEPELAAKYLTRWTAILKAADVEPAYAARRDRVPRSVVLFFDESIVDTPKGKVFILGCLVAEDIDAIRRHLSDVLASIVADFFATGEKATLEKKGLHWCDVTEDTRTQIVKTISLMPIRVYVGYSMYPAGADFLQTYRTILGPMLKPRFIALDGAAVSLSFEQHVALKQSVLQEDVTRIYEALEKANSRRPRALPQATIVNKREEPCLSAVDAALAVLGQYATSDKPAEAGKTETTWRVSHHAVRTASS